MGVNDANSAISYHEFVFTYLYEEIEMKKAVFNMEPFSCPSCIKKIETTLLKVDGVRDAKVLFHSGRVRVEFDSAVANAEALENTLNRLGYPVQSSKVT